MTLTNPPAERPDDEAASPSVVTAGDLGKRHFGWRIVVAGDEIELAGMRAYVDTDGADVVALVDRNRGELPSAFIGTERVYPRSAPCVLKRLVRGSRRRSR
ncbi:hypothetical protein ACFXGA_06320 [Actinosynnema sp. NPDC059335]|uniref:hypothetical protein n=1 Tax=Actinosynnema sp. NPDC059335 TaxID=3346804 RepID=UPI00366C812F